MREQNWYVFLIGRYAYRIRCESHYIHQLYRDKAIREYRNAQVKKKLFLCAMTITNILKGDKKYGN